jgi:hypothetical protein
VRRDQVVVSVFNGSGRSDPAVQLVQQQFRGAEVVPGDPIGVGVVVVLGEKFTALRSKQVESVVAQADATICKATGSE